MSTIPATLPLNLKLLLTSVSTLARASASLGRYLRFRLPDHSDADVADAVACLRYYAGMADKIHGQTTDAFGGAKLAMTLHQPIGVCGQM